MNINEHDHPQDSAGKIMTSNVPTVSPDTTIGGIEQLLLDWAKDFESINYIYVVDRERKLAGVVSVREVFLKSKTTPVSEVMRRDPVAVRPHAHQEHVGNLALRHNIKAVPVTDKNGVFLGAVLSDKILRIIHQELSEDYLRLAGIEQAASHYDNILKTPILRSIWHRLPWLLAGLGGGILIAKIIGSYETTLSQNLILAAFIPLIVYISDAVGTQMEAFIIRDLAFDPALNFFRYLKRQFLIVFLVGLLISAGLFAVGFVLYMDARVSAVLSISMMLAILSSVLTGLLVPYVFGKLKLDPANASGPLATIVQDTLSVTIYFTVASYLL